jgi:hypothetical protein
VGKEFNNADKGKSFKRGGDMATSMGKPVMKKGMSTAKDGMKKPTPMANTSMMGMKKGGMAKGGGIESKGKTKGKMITMKSGGKTC